MRDDLWNEALPEVQEALKRIPKDVRDERNFRIIRAMQLDCQKKILPPEQWTKLEEVQYRFKFTSSFIFCQYDCLLNLKTFHWL